VKRREFIALVGSLAAWPYPVQGQQLKPVVGFLRNTSQEESTYLLDALRRGMKEAGYV
jgi:hypothetical protein